MTDQEQNVVVDPCRIGVFLVKWCGQSFQGGQRCHIHIPKDTYSISQNYQEKKMNSGRTTCHSILSLNMSCRTCAASQRKLYVLPILNLQCKSIYIYLANIRRQEDIVFCWWKMERESPPSILVTRNPNWSQRLGTGTGCVKERYQHPKYTLPKVSCIVLLSDKI